MKHILTVCVLTLAVGVGVLLVTASPRERASINLRHPNTLLSFVANRLHAVPYVNTQIDGFTSSFRQTVQKHEGPKKSLAP